MSPGDPEKSGRRSMAGWRAGSPTWTFRSPRPIVERFEPPSCHRRRLPDVGRRQPITAPEALRRADERAVRLVPWKRRVSTSSPMSCRALPWRSTISAVPGEGVVLHVPAYPPFLELIRRDKSGRSSTCRRCPQRTGSCGTTTSWTHVSPLRATVPGEPGCGSCAIRRTPPVECSNEPSWK